MHMTITLSGSRKMVGASSIPFGLTLLEVNRVSNASISATPTFLHITAWRGIPPSKSVGRGTSACFHGGISDEVLTLIHMSVVRKSLLPRGGEAGDR